MALEKYTAGSNAKNTEEKMLKNYLRNEKLNKQKNNDKNNNLCNEQRIRIDNNGTPPEEGNKR